MSSPVASGTISSKATVGRGSTISFNDPKNRIITLFNDTDNWSVSFRPLIDITEDKNAPGTARYRRMVSRRAHVTDHNKPSRLGADFETVYQAWDAAASMQTDTAKLPLMKYEEAESKNDIITCMDVYAEHLQRITQDLLTEDKWKVWSMKTTTDVVTEPARIADTGRVVDNEHRTRI